MIETRLCFGKDVRTAREYCCSSGIPPLLVRQETAKILQAIYGGIDTPSYSALQDRLNHEKRFPPYQIVNEGLQMSFQDYVGPHQIRVQYLGMHIFDDFERLNQDNYNIGNKDEFNFGCIYHDIPEGISVVGDIPTPIKTGFAGEILEFHNRYEQALLNIISGTILNLEDTGFDTQMMYSLLTEFGRKESFRSQVLSYIDKLDAAMTCLHEVQYNGSPGFLKKLEWYKNYFIEVRNGRNLGKIQEFLRLNGDNKLGEIGIIFDFNSIIIGLNNVIETGKRLKKSHEKTAGFNRQTSFRFIETGGKMEEKGVQESLQNGDNTLEVLKRQVEEIKIYRTWKQIVGTIPEMFFGGQKLSGKQSLITER